MMPQVMARLTLKPRERALLAKRLREARENANLVAEQVQAKTRINPATLSLIENEHQEPTLAQLRALARTYRVPTSALLP